MGEIDSKAFQNALKQKFPNQEAEIKAVELLSLWQEKIKDPDWHPFKTIMIDESNVEVCSLSSLFQFISFYAALVPSVKSYLYKGSFGWEQVILG